MKTFEVNIYSFEELNESAKEKAINYFRDNIIYYGWYDDAFETLNAFSRSYLSLKIKDYSLGQDGCHVSYDIYHDDEILNLSGIRLMKWINNNLGDKLFKGAYVRTLKQCEFPVKHNRIKSIKLDNGKWMNSYYSFMKSDTCCVLTGMCFDDDILEPIYGFLKDPNSFNGNLEELIGECIVSFCSAVQRDIEHTYSDEGIAEFISCNEYEFYKDGRRYL